ncbi:hypothetical protein [Nocardioides ungokensis]
MRLLRGLLGGLLWILAAVVGLVAVILCVTVILLPLGLPLLGQARRMFTTSVRLMLPPALAHPVKTADKNARKKGRKAKDVVPDAVGKATKRSRNPFRRRSTILG